MQNVNKKLNTQECWYNLQKYIPSLLVNVVIKLKHIKYEIWYQKCFLRSTFTNAKRLSFENLVEFYLSPVEHVMLLLK